MKSIHVLATLGVLVAVTLRAERSSACGAVPPPYWTVADTIPAVDATGVPRDLAIVVKATPSSPPGGPSLQFSSFELTAEDGGAAVPGEFVQWYTTDGSAAWHPLAPLDAVRSYVLSAAIEQHDALPPAGVTGTDAVELRFTTGSSLTPPLELSGTLKLAFERYTRPVMKNCSCGGGGCEPTGTYAEVVRARATLPAVHGGFDADGYSAWLHLTEGAPAVFGGPGEGHSTGGEVNLMTYATLAPDELTEVTTHVPEGGSQPLCFALNVWDPAGHAVQAQPVCINPAELPAPVSSEQPEDSGDAACAVVFSPRTTFHGRTVLAWCVAALLLCRRRRRFLPAVARSRC